MASYKETFPNPHSVLPAVHVENMPQTMRNVELARREGADGVFLISMQVMSVEDLLKIQKAVKDEYSTWFIGINLLGVQDKEVFSYLNQNIDGVWTDNAEILEFQKSQPYADAIKQARLKSGWKGLYFGGVAFKYTRYVDDVATAAAIAKDYVDVVTTSGEATGIPPSVDKITKMKVALGDHPLGIASGIDITNVEKFKPITDCFIVASSLLIPKTENFDSSKLHDFIQVVRA